MQDISSLLQSRYGLLFNDVTETVGGLSADAFRIIAGREKYFLKVYNKKNVQSELWISNIDRYMPVLLQLLEVSGLRDRLPRPIMTQNAYWRVEDEDNVYILFSYMDGDTVGDKLLTQQQVLELAETIARLHSVSVEKLRDLRLFAEDFAVPFCDVLEKAVLSGSVELQDLEGRIIESCATELHKRIQRLYELSQRLRGKAFDRHLCHTDVHGWNLMASDHLILVDWEGLRLATPEADLYMFLHKPWWDCFWNHYRRFRPDAQLDPELLEFYLLKRKLEDICVFLSRILHDDLDQKTYTQCLTNLTNECKDLDAFCF